MLYVTTQPEALSATAANLAGIGAMMSAQNTAAAAPTTGVIPAAADQVSALAATQFAVHAQMYQAISAQAEAIHQQLVSTLENNATSYAAAEAANATTAC
jgi:PE family